MVLCQFKINQLSDFMYELIQQKKRLYDHELTELRIIKKVKYINIFVSVSVSI